MQPAQPLPQHRLLQQFVGSWNSVTEFVVPGQPQPVLIQGREIARLDMNGFWLVFELESGAAPMIFRGHRLLGYDPIQQAFVGVWVDQSCGSLQLSQGQVDATGKVFTMLGSMPDYFGQGPQTTRQVSTIIGPDEKEFTVWRDAADGSTTRIAKIHYTRMR